jgi:hypothetical protein
MTGVAFCHTTLDARGLKFVSFLGDNEQSFFISFAESLESFVAYFYISVLFEENHYDFASIYLLASRKIFAVNFF